MAKNVFKDAQVGDIAVFKNGGRSKITHFAKSHEYHIDDAVYLRFSSNKRFGIHVTQSGHLYSARDNQIQKSEFSIVKVIKKGKRRA